MLRLDLRSDYENADSIREILSLIVPSAFDLFGCNNTVDDSLEYGFCFFQIAFMDDKIKVCTCRFILNGHISLIEKLPVIILQCGSAVNGGQASPGTDTGAEPNISITQEELPSS